MTESGSGFLTLWASNGTPGALASVAAIRRWLLPASRQIDVVAVAPVDRSVSRRLTHWTTQQREDDMLRAKEAVQRSLEALDDVTVPTNAHVRWGTPSREIAQQAEESRADLIVLGAGSTASLQKAVLGSTAEQLLFDTTKSTFLARDGAGDTGGRVIVFYTSQRRFANAITMLNALHLAPEIPVTLVALLEPVKPFGSMFLTYNEEIRAKEQAAHDAQADVLRGHLAQVAGELAEAGSRTVDTLVQDCEHREMAATIEAMQPALVIAGDSMHADPLKPERRNLRHIASRLSCSVLVAR